MQDLSGKGGYHAKMLKAHSLCDKDSLSGAKNIDLDGFKLACKTNTDTARTTLTLLEAATPDQLGGIANDITALQESVKALKATYQSMEGTLAFKVQEQAHNGRSDKLKIRHAKARIAKSCTQGGYGPNYAKTIVEQTLAATVARDTAAQLREEADRAAAAAEAAKAAAAGETLSKESAPALNRIEPVTIPQLEANSDAAQIQSTSEPPPHNTRTDKILVFDVTGCGGLKSVPLLVKCLSSAVPPILTPAPTLARSLRIRMGSPVVGGGPHLRICMGIPVGVGNATPQDLYGHSSARS